MKLPRWVANVRASIAAAGLRLFSGRLNGGFSVYFGKPAPSCSWALEREYTTADGRIIPVYRGYRYSVKAGWRSCPGLNYLAQLEERKRLVPSEMAFLKKAVGTRTIMVPFDEARSVSLGAISRNSDLFIPDCQSDSGFPEFKIDEHRLQETVSVFKRRHAAMFNQLSAAGVFHVPQRASVLEIGYTTGGHSIFAFERLGFRAFGIDNYYGGLIDRQTLHGNNKKQLGSEAVFEVGDITKLTPFPSECMDVIFSTSVLEHIQDLAGAFGEMYRLLKPGGAIIHNYSPYFCHDGAHALGIGDSPWVHVRLGEEEYLRYLNELRPNEYAIAAEWVKGALHRDMPQCRVQRLVSAAGFRIGLWMAKPSPKNWLADLTPEIVRECFDTTPGIGIEDLVARSVSFVAIKN